MSKNIYMDTNRQTIRTAPYTGDSDIWQRKVVKTVQPTVSHAVTIAYVGIVCNV